jgi:hypothetical protein
MHKLKLGETYSYIFIILSVIFCSAVVIFICFLLVNIEDFNDNLVTMILINNYYGENDSKTFC